MTTDLLLSDLQALSDDARAVHATRFFRTGKGEYGEGDQFIGVSMPEIRQATKLYRNLPLSEIKKLLASPIHEHRMAAVVIMADVFKKLAPQLQREYFECYVEGVRNNQINNWDLVDVSAPYVVGSYCLSTNADILYKMARTNHLWQKRTAILSTFAYLRAGEATHTIEITKILLHDTHDLIHKAVGWLLREMGKRVSEELLLDFLDQNATQMPRTMLRYAIERLPEQKRRYYLSPV